MQPMKRLNPEKLFPCEAVCPCRDMNLSIGVKGLCPTQRHSRRRSLPLQQVLEMMMSMPARTLVLTKMTKMVSWKVNQKNFPLHANQVAWAVIESQSLSLSLCLNPNRNLNPNPNPNLKPNLKLRVCG